jgi:hypothetical protein
MVCYRKKFYFFYSDSFLIHPFLTIRSLSPEQEQNWGRGSEWYSHPRQQNQRGSKLGGKINILNEIFHFWHSTDFKILSKKKKSTNNCGF